MKKAIGCLILLIIVVGASVSAIMLAGLIEFLKFLGVLSVIMLINLIINFAINLITE